MTIEWKTDEKLSVIVKALYKGYTILTKDLEDPGMFPNHKFESFTYAIMERIRNVTKTVHKCTLREVSK